MEMPPHKAAFYGESPELTEDYIHERFPNATYKEGEIGVSGVVFYDDNDNPVVTVTSPEYKPDSELIQRSDLVPWSMREIDPGLEERIAKQLLLRAKCGMPIGDVADEREGWWLRRNIHGRGKLDRLPRAWQIEGHSGLLEGVSPPFDEPYKLRRHAAEYLLRIYRNRPGRMLSEASVPPVGTPLGDDGFRITDGPAEPYMKFVHGKLKELAHTNDDFALQLGRFIAEQCGFDLFKASAFNGEMDSYKRLRSYEPYVLDWCVAARQWNKMYPHLVDMPGEPYPIVPSRIAIAMANIFASTMGAIPSILSFCSPMIFGKSPKIMTPDGIFRQPRDYRDLNKHILKTASPGQLIRDFQHLRANIRLGIIKGNVSTPARAAFYNPGLRSFASHSDDRVRCDSSSLGGHLEDTSSGPTQWPDDEIAGDGLRDLLALSAAEAVAEGATVEEHFRGQYGGFLGRNDDRVDITHGYNLYGRRHEAAVKLIECAIAYACDMSRKYNLYFYNVHGDLLVQRLGSLLMHPTVTKVSDYSRRPLGCLSEVVTYELENGATPMEVETQLCRLQLRRYLEWAGIKEEIA
jgi:hypothetical protein